ncbi:MAG: dihydrofolate reductase family protein, partial [Nitrososphaerales archaeon]
VDLKKLLVILKRRGVKRLLVEGGGEINWSMLSSGFVDEIILTLAPRIVGGRDAITFVEGKGFEKIDNGVKLKLEKTRKIDNELILSYKIIN